MEDLEEQLKRAVGECDKLRTELATSQQSKTTAEKKQQAAIQKMNKV